MLQKIKELIYNQIQKSELLKMERSKSFVNFDKANTVLILFESNYSEKNPEIKAITSELNASGKKVILWGFVNKKKVETPIYPDYNLLCNSDFNWLGQPSSNLIEKLNSVEYDWLLDLTTNSILPFQYITLYSIAKFKIGLKREKTQPYDFMLDLSHFTSVVDDESFQPDASFLYKQIIFYLKNIQTSD